MSWWAALYVALLIAVGVNSVRCTIQHHHGIVATILEVATSIVWPLLVTAYFVPPLASWLGRTALPLFLLAAIWTLVTIKRDFSQTKPLAGFSPLEVAVAYGLAIGYTALLVVPVVILGGLVVRRAFTGMA